MSERIIDSASCCLVRSWDSDELYMAHRVLSHRAFPDTWTFPGGRIEEEDRKLPVEGLAGEAAASHACLARELFEETGVLLAAGLAPGLDLAPARRELLDGRAGFGEVLTRLGARLRGADAAFLGTKTTPPMTPVRFRNRFCMAALPPGQEPVIWPGELDEGRWFRPSQALAQWEALEIRIAPPMLIMIEEWGPGDAASARDRLSGFDDSHFEDRLPRVRFAPGVLVAGLLAPTQPPAIGTNTYIVGERSLWIVDPGTSYPDQVALLLRLLEELRAEGRELAGILLTHHHPDHVGCVDELVARWKLPVRDFPSLKDGARIPLGAGWDLEALHTPGHAPDHLCFFERRFGSLLCGDMVSTVSSILIDPDHGGDMGAYLTGLRRLAALGARTLYPSHGSPTTAPRAALESAIAHREARAEALLAALGADPEGRTLEEVLPEVYADVPPAMFPWAMKNLRAAAAWLAAEGRVRNVGAGFTPARPDGRG